MRTTAAELDHMVEWINKITDPLEGCEYEIDWAYGQPRLVRNRGSVDVSPRLSKPRLAEWMRAFIAGIGAPRRIA